MAAAMPLDLEDFKQSSTKVSGAFFPLCESICAWPGGSSLLDYVCSST